MGVPKVIQYQTGTWTIPPGGNIQVVRSGDFVSAVEANIPFRLRIGDNPFTDFAEGLTFEPDAPFLRLGIENPDLTQALVVTLANGRGTIRDNRLVIADGVSVINKTQLKPINYFPGSVSNSVPGRPANVVNVVNVDPGTFIQIAEANPLRQSLHMRVASNGQSAATTTRYSLFTGNDDFVGVTPWGIFSSSKSHIIPGGGSVWMSVPSSDVKPLQSNTHEVVYV